MNLDQEKVRRANETLDSVHAMLKGFQEDMLDLCVEYVQTIDDDNNEEYIEEVVEEKEDPIEESTSYTSMYL